MIAVAYVRVSTHDQVQGTSLENQTQACIKYAAANNIELDPKNIFREEGESAKFANRPALLAMLKYCRIKKGAISTCIIWKVDRLARDLSVHTAIKMQLSQCGVKLVSVTEPITDDPLGKAMEGILAVFAQLDNEVRTIRTTSGMKARTKQGGWPHEAPFGYRKIRTPSGITTIEPTKESVKVKRLLEEFSTGSLSIREANDLAYHLGIRTKVGNKRGWQATKNMLMDIKYAGMIKSFYSGGQTIPGLHQAIIDEATYYRIQSIILSKRKLQGKEKLVDWPLRGGFIKHTCGRPMTGSSPRGNAGPSPRYSCMHCRQSVTGKKVSAKRDKVHDDFIDLLTQITPTEGTVKLFREVIVRQWNLEFKDATERSRRIANEIETLRARKSRIIDLYVDGKLTEEEKGQKIEESEISLNALKMQLIDSEKYTQEQEHIIDGAMLFLSNAGLFWNIADIKLKGQIQNLIFPEGLVYECTEGFRTPILNKSYLLNSKIALKGDLNSNLVAPTGLEPVTLGL